VSFSMGARFLNAKSIPIALKSIFKKNETPPVFLT
jgi:hypothetical protein